MLFAFFIRAAFTSAASKLSYATCCVSKEASAGASCTKNEGSAPESKRFHL
jgi:hypothetical protein